ncbi:uncharacterized protein I303_102132 [Kwoniella dejecticola CBS 10117]|uniref:Mitochondrial ornithine carrier protein n=1 Tax=Kwoniella dejecticola CBS 10117 TaxID=1296121 RepID=A0A1A6ABU1_9TREE|nr:mitochondrial ornithine carrier protein [Kwoniella dejecticola CBS 10117]OBR87520.1 mitochondrial ornithine carrier protein [Kwoniella dejecticola CBS 10117]
MGAEQGPSNALEDITFGSVAGMVAKVFEHPFDLVKVRLQSQPTDRPATFKGPWDCFTQTRQKEGLFGLYRGLTAPLVGAACENATLFLCYNKWKELILAVRPELPNSGDIRQGKGKGKARELTTAELAVAGGGAGFMASFVLTPIELIKCRMQVQRIALEGAVSPLKALPESGAHPFATTPHIASASGSKAATAATGAPKLQGPISLIGDVIKRSGFKGLWLGQTGTLFRETGGSAAWFATFEYSARLFIAQHQAKLDRVDPSGSGGKKVTKGDLSKIELMISGAMAGVAYTVSLFPADSIKSAIQTQAELNPNKPSPSFAQMAKIIYRSRGIKGLYAGCGTTIAKSAPSSAMIFAIYETLESNFGGFLG